MKVEGFEFPDDLFYMKGHVWVRLDSGNARARMGVTSLGNSLAKEIVHVDLPDDDAVFDPYDPMASFETIKSVTEVCAPFNCKVVAVNEKLLDDPSLINKDFYGGGWIVEIEALEGTGNLLMDAPAAAEYFKKILLKEKERFAGIYD